MEYFDHLMRAMLAFQFIEEGLKQYLRIAYKIVQRQCHELLIVRLSREDIENRPLGGLIDEFRKFSDDEPFLDGLRRLNRLRNEVAHRGFLLTYEEQTDEKRMAEYSQRAQQVATAADGCLREVIAKGQELAEILNRLENQAPSHKKLDPLQPNQDNAADGSETPER